MFFLSDGFISTFMFNRRYVKLDMLKKLILYYKHQENDMQLAIYKKLITIRW